MHDWRAANWIMIVATATESTVGANHDIMMQGDRKNDLISQEVRYGNNEEY